MSNRKEFVRITYEFVEVSKNGFEYVTARKITIHPIARRKSARKIEADL